MSVGLPSIETIAKRTWAAIILPFVLFISLTVNSDAQTTTDGNTPRGIAPGAPAGSYPLSGFEQVDLYSGRVNFSLPVVALQGRGQAGIPITVRTARASWRVEHHVIYDQFNLPCNVWYPQANWWYEDISTSPFWPGGRMIGRQSRSAELLDSTTCGPGFGAYAEKSNTHLVFIAPDGTEYQLWDALQGGVPRFGNCVNPTQDPNRGKVFVTADGSSATFISSEPFSYTDMISPDPVNGDFPFQRTFDPTGYLLLRDGTRYRINQGRVEWIRDRNGNVITFDYTGSPNPNLPTKIKDSLNREITFAYDLQEAPYGFHHKITVKGFGNQDRIVRVSLKNLGEALRAGFSLRPYSGPTGLFPQLDNVAGIFAPGVVSAIWLPDGRSYQFYYNDYGELARIELPTGGAFDYDYEGGQEGGTVSGVIGAYNSTRCVDYGNNPPDMAIYRRLVQRRVYKDKNDNNSLESITTYSKPAYLQVNGNNATKVSVKNHGPVITSSPISSSDHYFHGYADSGILGNDLVAFPAANESKEFQTDALTESGTVWQRTENVWQSGCSITATSGAANYRLISTKVTVPGSNALSSQISKQDFIYDCYNNLIDTSEYDYGVGAASALLRRTHTDYLTSGYDTIAGGVSNPNPDATIHIRSLPTQQSVYDANGVERARTTYEYDTAPLGALVDRAGITGLVSRSGQAVGAGYAPTSDLMRGNPTKVTRWLLATTGPVAADTGIFSSSQYDVAGNIVKTRDSNNNDTTFDYSDSFSGSFTSNTFAFLKSTTSPNPGSAYGGNMPLVTTSTYDFSSGKVVSTTDPNGKVTSFEYVDPLDRLTKVFRPSGGGMTEYQYGDTPGDLYLRTLTQQSTGFGGVTLADYALFDGLGRATRSAHYEGSDFSGARWSVRDTRYDALGRVSQSSNPEIVSDYNAALPGNAVWTTTTYDALSRVIEVTTPDNAKVKTTYLGNQVTVEDQANRKRSSITDGLGRLIQVNEAPNDPAYNYQTNYTYDVLGNLIRVRQGGFPTGGSPDPTVQFRRFYYDSLSRLVYANNPEQNATIAFNPPGEAGTMWTMAYVYDNNGNLTGRTDARNVTTTYAYDALNRNTTVNYSDTPTISPDIERFYDTATNGKGRLQRVVSNLVHPGSASRVDSRTVINGYDDLGRVISQTQGFLKSANNWQDYTVSRTYDLASHVKTQTFPSGGSPVTYGYGAGGRTGSFEGFLGGQGYFLYSSGMVYNAAGQMTEEVFGTSPTPIYHTARYNNRFQMYEVNAGTFNDVNNTASSAYWNRGRLRFFYNQAALNAEDPSLAGTDNNGNVLRQEHWVPTATQTNQINAALSNVTQYAMPMRDDYFYDPINRITKVEGRQRTASAYPGQGVLQSIYQQAYSYDKFGNRKLDMTQTWGTGINGSVVADIYDVDKPTNRLKGMIYDAAGNLVKTKPISPQPENRVYDAENRMITATLGATSHYVYDGDGRRVRRILPTGEFWQVYGIDGELLAEYQWNGSTASLKKEYGYRAGQLLVVADPTEPNANKRVQWLIADHLGTPRMVVDKTGSLSGVTRHDYLPFGEELTPSMGTPSPTIVRSVGLGYQQTDSVRQKFSGKERDIETGLDYFGARYHSSVQGRFISCDPAGVTKRHILNPQKWNLYIYVLNNPLGFTDPNGRKEQGTGGSRTIDVFLNFSTTSERNTTKQGNKVTQDSGPDWKKLQSDAKKNGYDLRIFDKGQSSIDQVRSSLKNSGVTVIVGHSQGVTLLDSGRFEGRSVDVRGAAITPNGVVPGHRYEGTGAFNAIGPTEPKPDVNAQATCLFVCHSIDVLPGAFNFNGSDQAFVGTDGGLTRVGTLENAAFAFVETYVNTQGNLDASVNAAQKAVDESRDDIDKGDKVKLKKVP